MRGRWSAAFAAAFLLVFACAPPKNIAVVVSPTPSPSPTPTAPLQASSPAFHIGEVGVGYSPVALSATGGVAPYKWTVSAGALPGGLTLGGDGTLSGNPTTAGDFSFTIQVADAGGGTTKVDGKIGIATPLSAGLIPACAKYCNVELGCVEVCGAFGQQSGGVAPYSYSVVQGPLPAGTALSGLSLTGTFGGASGYLKFTVAVTDSLGSSTTITPTFWMYDHIALASGDCSTTFYAIGCKTSLAYSGGVPGGTPQISSVTAVGSYCPPPNYTCQPSSTPPPGFSATVSGGAVLVGVAPASRPGFAYKGTVTIVLADQSPCSSGTPCSTSAPVTISIGLG